jgi:ribosomal protein S20
VFIQGTGKRGTKKKKMVNAYHKSELLNKVKTYRKRISIKKVTYADGVLFALHEDDDKGDGVLKKIFLFKNVIKQCVKKIENGMIHKTE